MSNREPSPLHEGVATPAASWTVLLLTRDLMISSRIEHAIRLAGLSLKMISDLEVAMAAMAAGDVTVHYCVVLDLTSFPDAAATIAERTKSLETGRIVMIGFGPHVATGTLTDAKSAGCAAVFTRGQFLARAGELTAEVLVSAATKQA